MSSKHPQMGDMAPDIAIRARHICKSYKLGVINRTTFRDELLYRWYRLRGIDPHTRLGKINSQKAEHGNLFHALDNVSFDVSKGETVGFIGRNGAGKSTILKILARITAPDNGEAIIRGRVGSLLEVGTGFHPELTGRENIYMNGTILGMTKSEIDSKFEEIVDFSEIGSFLDTPVKRYSSGMYVKLAFSVAASLDTDILLVDEVLSVGDAAFRAKSLARMKQIAADGRTIIFVSHAIGNVKELCSRCILFDHGAIIADGPTEEVAERYAEMTLQRPSVVQHPAELHRTVWLEGIRVTYDDLKTQWVFQLDCMTASGFRWNTPRVILVLRRKGATGPALSVFDSACQPLLLPKTISGKASIIMRPSPAFHLPAGTYVLDIQLTSGTEILQKLEALHQFEIPQSHQLPHGWTRTPAANALVHAGHTWHFINE